MLRAAEILANIHKAQRGKAVAVRLLQTPAVLASPRIRFEVGKTTRHAVERELGIAFSYPARGWHTYAVKESGRRCFLSAFYKAGTLIAVELYVPSAPYAPALAPADLGGFILEPEGVSIGMDHSNAFEGTFEGGAVYVIARAVAVDRIAVYARESTPSP